MFTKLKLIIIISIVFTSFSYSQRYKIYEGSFENLKDIKSFKAEFNYDNIQVHGFESEEAFIKEKQEKRKSNPEQAEKFKRDWFLNRDKYYNPAFINYFNSYFKKEERKIVDESQYLMKVHLTWIYPGYALEPAKLSADIDFIDTFNSKKLLAVHFDKVIGIEKKTMETVEYERIIGAFEKLAKNLAIQLK
ncbi:hypothetical protein ASE21_16535 [Flavobacterium sp. Root901]|uniref:hypothetical protein n=1 Tax=Flavobacterium sp. Root901 TaxID=1736605 RepID=UPI00070F7C48|nr:hypothetical protein [Flavobacterium sp. Root901]KRD08292.1 hypothetical protein ASE21_16535 [Flavobacterium sp. Root901]